MITADICSSIGPNVLQAWDSSAQADGKVVYLGGSSLVIWDPKLHCGCPCARTERNQSLVSSWSKTVETVSIFHSLAISMWSKSTLKSGPVTAYLYIHVPQDNFDITVWDLVLQLLVEIYLIYILVVICRCLTMDDRDFGMISHKSQLFQSLIHW